MAQPTPRRCLLVGMRGAGKTAAGRRACASLQIPFIDLDELALLRCGAPSVRDAFARPGGEATWRDAECAALQETISSGTACVVAIGAGAPEHPASADAIRAARRDGWLVVHVRVSPRTSAHRLAAGMGDRPALTSLPPADELAALHSRRTPVYESLSDLEVDGELPLDELARSIGRAVSAP